MTPNILISAEHIRSLRARLRGLTWMVIVGLFLSGLTAMPLPQEAEWLARLFGAPCSPQAGGGGIFADWLGTVCSALRDINDRYSFVFYGGDWLAFGHFMIALAFVGPLRDPVKNVWIYDFGMLASALVVPFALIMGHLRGVPVFWRLIDCAFGIGAFIPLCYCRHYVRELSSALGRLT